MRHNAESREGIRKIMTSPTWLHLMESHLGQAILECLADLDDVSTQGHPPHQDPDALVRKQLHDAQQNIQDLQALAQRLTVTLGRVADGTMAAHRDLEDGSVQIESVPMVRLHIRDVETMGQAIADAVVRLTVADHQEGENNGPE